MSRVLSLIVVGIVLVAVAPASADIPPRPPAPQKAQLVIIANANANAPTLVVPQGLAPAAQPGVPVPPKRGDLGPTDADPRAAIDTPSVIVVEADRPRTHTVVAGLFLATAFSVGGLWLARRGRGAALLLAAGALAAFGTAAWADFILPKPGQNFRVIYQGPVTVVAGPAGGNVELTVPSRLVGQPAPLPR